MIAVTVDTRAFSEMFKDIITEAFPNAAANALNRTAEEVQARLRQEEHLVFTIRSPQSAQLMERLVSFQRGDRATPDKLEAQVQIRGPENNRGAANILTRHIKGGTFTAPSANKPFFLPTDSLRPSKTTVIPRRLYPTNLRLVDRRGISGTDYATARVNKNGVIQPRGKLRSFILIKNGRVLGAYQRGGGVAGRTRRDDFDLLWFATPTIHLKPRFRFDEIGERIAAERLPINMEGMLKAQLDIIARRAASTATR